jgi:hypothetical protein
MAGATTTSRDNAGHLQGALRDLLLNFNLAVADLETLRASYAYMLANDVISPTTGAIGTTASTIKTTATITYVNAGVVKTKAAADPMWTPGSATSNTLVAINSFQKYLLGFDATGAAKVFEGVQSLVSLAAVKLPSVATLAAAGITVVETVSVSTDGTHTFTPGTTAFNATGITSAILGGIDPLFLVQAASLLGAKIGDLSSAAFTT